MAGENGGGAFLIIYIALVFTLGLSVMLCEFVIGRASQSNPVGMLDGGISICRLACPNIAALSFMYVRWQAITTCTSNAFAYLFTEFVVSYMFLMVDCWMC